MAESHGFANRHRFFSEWADNGRDEGMEKGHTASVNIMLERLLSGRNEPFTALDIGCGNGWVVRRLKAHALCSTPAAWTVPVHDRQGQGVDPEGDYVEAMLPDWKPAEPVDLIHTMECLYYLQDPLGFSRRSTMRG